MTLLECGHKKPAIGSRCHKCRPWKRVGGKRRDRVFKIRVMMPPGADDEAMMAYIEDAVATWRGQLHPSDPIFWLKSESVKVKRAQAARHK